MLRRYGKFLADWRDEKGQRKRKAFATKKAALRFQQKQQASARAKKAQAPRQSRSRTRRRSSSVAAPKATQRAAQRKS